MLRNVATVLSLLLLLVYASTAVAAERTFWIHSKGHFEHVKDNKWTEKNPEGMIFHFEEKERTAEFILLFDKSRDCHVRLYNRCEVKFNDKEYQQFYEGKWEK